MSNGLAGGVFFNSDSHRAHAKRASDSDHSSNALDAGNITLARRSTSSGSAGSRGLVAQTPRCRFSTRCDVEAALAIVRTVAAPCCQTKPGRNQQVGDGVRARPGLVRPPMPNEAPRQRRYPARPDRRGRNKR